MLDGELSILLGWILNSSLYFCELVFRSFAIYLRLPPLETHRGHHFGRVVVTRPSGNCKGVSILAPVSIVPLGEERAQKFMHQPLGRINIEELPQELREPGRRSIHSKFTVNLLPKRLIRD